MHIYQEGGHGFGARDTGLPLNSWKTRYVEWLRAFGFFDKPLVGEYVAEFLQAFRHGGGLPRLTARFPAATMADSFAAQKRIVRELLQSETLSGFKGGATNVAAQQTMGIDHPMTAVLFQTGRVDAEGREQGNSSNTIVNMEGREFVIETELGFVISTGADVSYRLTSIEHTKGAIGSVVPVIELPENYASRMGGALTAADAIASNMGSARYLVGRNAADPDSIDPDQVAVNLSRDGRLLHESSGGIVKDGQWANLMTLMNQIVDQGYSLKSGDLIICGALGPVHPASAGVYRADFGVLGRIDFELRE
jgi:2-keto-4-pentenoate hydratase